MTVTINTLGPNSRQLVIEGETGPLGIIDAVNTSLVALGWTLFDSISSGANNCLVTKVYSALCDDADRSGPSTKYMILRYDAPMMQCFVSCCESWNDTTHVATNECYTNGRMVVLSMQYSFNSIYIFASPRYACFMGVVDGEVGAWQGVFEFEREAPQDIATSSPCFGWTSSLSIGENWYCLGTVGYTSAPNKPMVFCIPRLFSGETGQAAARALVIKTSFGEFPPSNSANYNINYSNNPHNGFLGTFGYGAALYPFDSTKKIASSLKLGGYTIPYHTGRIYGLSVIPSSASVACNILDTLNLPIDADNFLDPAGTPTLHTALGINGGFADSIGTGTNRLVISKSYTDASSSQSTNNMILVNGRSLFVSHTNGLFRIDTSTGTVTTIFTTPSFDMKFDGTHYLYISTNTGVVKLNTADSTYSTLACCLNNAGSLAIDDTYLYAGYRTNSTTPKIDIINLSSFTVERTYTPPAFTSSCIFTNLNCADYDGYVYGGSFNPCNSVNDAKLWKILGSTASGTSYTFSPTSISSARNAVLHWDGTYFTVYFIGNSGTNTAIVFSILPLTMSTGLAYTSGSTMTLGATKNGAPENYTLFKGSLLTTMCESTSNAATVCTNRNNTIYTDLPGFGNYSYLSMFTNSVARYLASDGCSLYAGGTAPNSIVKITNGYGPYSSMGNPSAKIAIKV